LSESISIQLADLTDARQAEHVTRMVNDYAGDAFGQGAPLSAEVIDRLVPGLLAHGNALVFLAYHDTEPVGVAVCLVGFSTFAARPLINIHDLAVVSAARGRGVGRRLLEAIEAEARSRGCCKVTLEVRPDNRRAMTLYQRCGYRSGEYGVAESMQFWHKPLD